MNQNAGDLEFYDDGGLVGMERAGVVSIWLGFAQTEKRLREALSSSFDDEGEFLGSEFSRAFDLGYYEDGCVEADWSADSSPSIETLFAGISYQRDVLPGLYGLLRGVSGPHNAFVLLYNFEYDGRTADWTADDLKLKYYGNYRYKTTPHPMPTTPKSGGGEDE